jgi:phosphate transport system substrate-binding protein
MMHKHTWRLILVVIAGLATGCAGGGEAAPGTSSGGDSGQGQQSIAVSGAFALYPMMVTWAEAYQQLHPDVRIDVSAGGAGKGMADAVAGAVDIGMVSRDVKPEEIQQGAYPIGVTRDAVFAVVNAQNPVLDDLLKAGLSSDMLNKIYITGEVKTWGQVVGGPEVRDEIHVYTRSDSAGAAEMWAKFAGGKAQDDLQGIGVNADPGLLDAVIKDPLGIGYNNLNYAFDLGTGKAVAGGAVIPLDANGNGTVDAAEALENKDAAVLAVSSGMYPAPPARIEWLVTRGSPSGATRDFIRWILGDGQKLLASAGYVPLTNAELAVEQAKVN